METFELLLKEWELSKDNPYTPKEEDDNSTYNQLTNTNKINEIDLHGMTEREAINQLDIFIKANKKANVKKIKIIHGVGHNSKDKIPVLKNAVKSYLDFHENIRYQRPGRPGEGNRGVTIAFII